MTTRTHRLVAPTHPPTQQACTKRTRIARCAGAGPCLPCAGPPLGRLPGRATRPSARLGMCAVTSVYLRLSHPQEGAATRGGQHAPVQPPRRQVRLRVFCEPGSCARALHGPFTAWPGHDSGTSAATSHKEPRTVKTKTFCAVILWTVVLTPALSAFFANLIVETRQKSNHASSAGARES